MAQFQYSEIGITDIRGKIAGTQFTRVRSGGQGILPTTPRQPFTSAQEASQYLFQQVMAYWPQLDESQREAWNEAALLPDWTRTNRTGDPYQPTGQSLFVQLNLSAFKYSFPITSPPTFPSFTSIVFTDFYIITPERVRLTFSTGTISEDETMLIYTTMQLSRGRTSVSQRQFFFTANFDSETFTDDCEIYDNYVARWGVPIENLKVSQNANC